MMSQTLNPSLAAFNYFEAIFQNSRQNTILLLSENGTVLEINDAFTDTYGYTRNDIIGKNFDILFTESDRGMNVPQKELGKVLTSGQAADNNFLVGKERNLVWVSGESILAKNAAGDNCILKIIQNINTQKIAENSIVHLNNFNESILRSIDDAVIVLDESLCVFKANAAFSNLFEILKSGKENLHIERLLKPFDITGELSEKIKKVNTTKTGFFNYPLEIDTTTAGKKVFDFSCRVIEHSSDNKHILLVAHDITLQKQSEKEREDIIGFVAHELRNPLANIVLCNEMMTQLINDNDVNELEEYLHRSKNNVMRLNKMIGELYDATKFNSGNFNLEISTFNFEEMIEEALDTIEVLHPDYSIILEGECTVPVSGDRYRLIQVITNFLSNGIKYSNNNTNVIIRIGMQDNEIIVSVKDEGLGISPKQLPKIFGRFFRAERTKNLEGIGLGLYLCRRIIEAHRGKIWAESEEGKGSTFYFSIPV